jgi:hypothetical protein
MASNQLAQSALEEADRAGGTRARGGHCGHLLEKRWPAPVPRRSHASQNGTAASTALLFAVIAHAYEACLRGARLVMTEDRTTQPPCQICARNPCQIRAKLGPAIGPQVVDALHDLLCAIRAKSVPVMARTNNAEKQCFLGF